MRSARLALAAATVLLSAATPAGTGSALRVPGGDPIIVHQAGGLSESTLASLGEVSRLLGTSWVVFHRGVTRLEAVTRGGVDVQRARAGYAYPMASGAVDPWRAWPLLPAEAIAILHSGSVVMGEATARLRGAVPGDTLVMLDRADRGIDLTLGAVVPDEQIEWFELLFSDQVAVEVGLNRPSYAVVWGYPQLEDTLIELGARLTEPEVRILSPDQAAPAVDGVLPSALVKERFGEFAFRRGRGDSIIIEPGWREANLVDVVMPLVGPLRCHREVVPYLRGALIQIEAEGLADELNVADIQTSGGCYNPRLIRGAHAATGISRHAWGIAVDFNPSTNPYGAAPALSDRLGGILRGWGFSWGAGWVFRDPMHFEWARLPNGYPNSVCWTLQADTSQRGTWTATRSSGCSPG